MIRWLKLSLCVMFVAAAVVTAGCGGDKPADSGSPAATDGASDDAGSETKE